MPALGSFIKILFIILEHRKSDYVFGVEDINKDQGDAMFINWG